MMLRDTDLILR